MSKVIENCVKVNNCSEYYLKRKDKVRVKDLWNDVYTKSAGFLFLMDMKIEILLKV